MIRKAISFRVWIGGMFLGLMVGAFAGAAGAPEALAGLIGVAVGVGVVALMVLSPEVVLNCPHCGSMLRHNGDTCPKCGKDVRTAQR